MILDMCALEENAIPWTIDLFTCSKRVWQSPDGKLSACKYRTILFFIFFFFMFFFFFKKIFFFYMFF